MTSKIYFTYIISSEFLPRLLHQVDELGSILVNQLKAEVKSVVCETEGF